MFEQEYQLGISCEVAAAALESFYREYQRSFETRQVELTREETKSGLTVFLVVDIVYDERGEVIQQSSIIFRPTPDNRCALKIEPVKQIDYILWPDPIREDLGFFLPCESFCVGFLNYLAEKSYVEAERQQPNAADPDRAAGTGQQAHTDSDGQVLALPKDEATLRHYRDSWKLWLEMKEEYKLEVLDGNSKKAQPTREDFRARVIEHLGWNVSTRTLSTVRKLGNAGVLTK